MSTDKSSIQIGNEKGLAALSESVPPELMASLLSKAESTLEKRMKELHQGLAASNSHQIYEAAHSIKGSSGSLFADRISALGALMEEASADMDAVGVLLPAMDKAAAETISWWRSKQ
ncbi:MAG: Hpt domain-containing protein [Rhodospirillales bacterium]|jgi:HPt (histidine-containing phosphotransfer) domain-containing protein|nr:Hpt domain-containing protein [Rhodospirillales bacterium]MBT4041506.1 Hpt domain-containing protein [Rhodospirillales bacterium]MBT4627511.1 Hpt domain-containing protein [Rhodospirillales bacterium]MBT5352913.1 Hpt domain-containing protein [Rhodospirillales bacterium]MBT5520213.1 Hpt domain-containing protein [Rhodospirillales bacterium]